MDKIREMLARLSTLLADELAELRALIIAEAKTADEQAVTPESVAILNELAEAGEQVMAEQQTRDETQAQAEADAETARKRLAAVSGEAEAEGEEPEAGADGEEPEAEPEAAEAAAEAVAAAAASLPSGGVARMAARAPKPAASPEAAAPTPNRAVLTASGAMRGVDPSKPIEGRYELAKGMADTLKRMSREGASRGDVVVASATWEYPEDRKLTDDQERNAEIIDAVTHPQALVASGGICAPVNVDYSVPTWATAERPLRDGLPAFEATRGGLRFVQPPDMSALSGATGIWTEATDASPGGSTKPILTVACGSEVQVLVDAVTTRLGFGNMQSRFAPEQVAANTDLAIAAAARVAENNLLAKLEALSVANITNTVVLGATRDLITVLEQALAAYRWVHRISPSQRFSAVFPAWVKDIIKVDLARELAHDNSSAFNVLAITDAQVEDLLKAHGVNPIWHLDGQAQNGSVYPLQGWTAQGGTSALKSFPAKVNWFLFPEGTVQFLDGGRLDLGVVRDSTLDATNDYETFVETFENLAYRGFANGLLNLVTSLCASGGSAGTVSTVGSCA